MKPRRSSNDGTFSRLSTQPAATSARRRKTWACTAPIYTAKCANSEWKPRKMNLANQPSQRNAARNGVAANCFPALHEDRSQNRRTKSLQYALHIRDKQPRAQTSHGGQAPDETACSKSDGPRTEKLAPEYAA